MAIEPLAVYSAIVSTGVAAWQVYTYFRDGARLRLSTGGNRGIVDANGMGTQTFIVVNAVNVGNRVTTIQAIGARVYYNRWKRFRRKSSKTYIFNVAPRGHTVPHMLEPGHSFMALVNQSDVMVKHSREQLMYMLVSHSVGKRDQLVRLRPIPEVQAS